MKAISFDIPSAKSTIYPALCTGIGLHWTWVFCIMFATGRILDTPMTGSIKAPIAAFSFAVFCGICATLLLVGLLGKKETALASKTALASVTALGFIATATLLVAAMIGSSGALGITAWVSGLLAGIASGYLLMAWGFAYRSHDNNTVAVNVAIGLLLALVIHGAVLWLDNPALLVAVALCAMLGEGILCSLSQNRAAAERADNKTEQDQASLRTYATPSYAKIAVVLVVFGFVDSILRELALSTFSAKGDLSSIVVGLLLISIGFITLFFFVYFFLERKSADESSYSFVTLFVVGASVVLLFFMNPADDLVYRFVCVVVYLLFEVHVWSLLAQIARIRQAPGPIVYGLGLFFLFVGQFLSPIANGFAASLAEPLQLENVTEPIILMLALLTAVVLLATGGSRKSSFREEDNEQVVVLLSNDEEHERKVKIIVQRYLLTDREEETLSMLIKGRSFAKISESLCVSENTTKTHVKNIYRKTGVHSKQELMDLVDSV